MRPRLTVLLGAGSTVSLNPGIPGLRGMPSTDDLTAHISRMQFPKVILNGTPFLLTDEGPFALNEAVPVLRLLRRALSNTFERVDFELILHAIEQLLPFASMRAGATSSDQFHPAIAAFVEMLKHCEILNDWSLLRATRASVIYEIHSEIRNRSFQLPKELPLHKLIVALAEEFRLAIFTLNYDDVVDGAQTVWFDGFVGEEESSTHGAFPEAKFFDPQAFDLWKDAIEPVLVHLHGSVRFGPSRKDFALVKYSNIEAAGEAISRSDKSSGGQIVSSDSIISGLNKAARLTLNPAPYGYYYRALIDSLLSNERLLVIGYGARDEHVNTWLEQFGVKHAERRRIGWVGMLKGEMVGERTPEKDMIARLSDRRFEDCLHYSTSEKPNALMECGKLRLGAAGFPLPDETQSELISFLHG
jgi:SIR2-like domain